MLTLLGSLLGFATSALTMGMKTWQQRSERQYQLEQMKLQLQIQSEGHSQQLKTASLQADIAEGKALYQHAGRDSGVAWIEGLRASVRPFITYAFFLLFVTVKTSVLLQSLEQAVPIIETVETIWDSQTQALFAAVISFWFGQRSLARFQLDN